MGRTSKSQRGSNATKGAKGFQKVKKLPMPVIDLVPAKQSMDITLKNNDPWRGVKTRKGTFWKDMRAHYDDFASSFLPTDDIYGSSGSGTDDIPTLAYFQYLAERRVGIAWRITKKPAEDAIRNRFRIMDMKGKIEERDDILAWCEDTDFYNQLAQALYYERCYGIAFLMKYYTNNDLEKEDLSKEVKPRNRRPVAFQAFPPTHMTPTNIHQTNYLDTDPQKWEISGGMYNPTQIHHSRIHVIMTRRVSHRWRGLSVFEPIWHSILSYFQAIIYLLKAFNKMGSMIPFMKIDSTSELTDLYDEYADLVDEMKMNGVFIGRQGDDMVFAPTDIAAGLRDLMEIWIEDIAAGTSFPVPILMGRAQAAGIGSQMYLVFERYYWNEIANIQASLSDDVLQIFRDSGFKKLERRRVDWQLAMTKTDSQRLADEMMELEIEMGKVELKASKVQLERAELENEMLEFQHLSNMLGMGEEEGNKKVDNKQFQDFQKLLHNKRMKFRERRELLFERLFGEEQKLLLEELKKA
ncbi:MAG: anti-CBASS protein Acb1 family protein [Candidatus Thorarchaeota archaeon]